MVDRHNTLAKWVASGNDFVLMDRRHARSDPPPDATLMAWARLLCARHTGVGADGLLVILPPLSAPALAYLRMFNPDGTEDMCANGLHCVGAHLMGPGPSECLIETRHGRLPVRRLASGRIECRLPPARFEAEALPARVGSARVWDTPLEVGDERVRLYGASTGTPHVVVFTDAPIDDARFYRLGPALECHPAFPERTTVTFACVRSPESVETRIWERGAGETLACGTGACAVVAITNALGRTGRTVAIASPGGVVHVTIEADADLRLSGEAHVVFHLDAWTGMPWSADGP